MQNNDGKVYGFETSSIVKSALAKSCQFRQLLLLWFCSDSIHIFCKFHTAWLSLKIIHCMVQTSLNTQQQNLLKSGMSKCIFVEVRKPSKRWKERWDNQLPHFIRIYRNQQVYTRFTYITMSLLTDQLFHCAMLDLPTLQNVRVHANCNSLMATFSQTEHRSSGHISLLVAKGHQANNTTAMLKVRPDLFSSVSAYFGMKIIKAWK